MKNSNHRPALIGIGLFLVLIIGILIGVGFSGDGDSASATGSKATSSPSKTASPAPSRTAKPSRTPTPKPTPKPRPVTVEYTCGASVGSPKLTFSHVKEAWAAAPMEICDATEIGAGTPSELELTALKTAYGPDYKRDSLAGLWGICAKTAGIPIDRIVSGAQGAELEGAFLLCPDHPKAATIQANIVTGKDLSAKQADNAKAAEEGRLVGEGSYLVGVDVQPGTWQSMGEKVEDCYWEVSDAQGNIMANNFIRIAPQFTIEIPAGASGFTVRGCSFKQISP